MELYGIWKDGSKMFQGGFKGVLRHFQGSCCFRKFWRLLQERLKSVFRVNQEYFIEG